MRRSKRDGGRNRMAKMANHLFVAKWLIKRRETATKKLLLSGGSKCASLALELVNHASTSFRYKDTVSE